MSGYKFPFPRCKYHQSIHHFGRCPLYHPSTFNGYVYKQLRQFQRTRIPCATWPITCSNSAPSPSTRHGYHIAKNPLPPLYQISPHHSSMMNMNLNVHVIPAKKHHVTAHKHAHYTANTCYNCINLSSLCTN